MSKYSLLGVCQPQRGGLSYFCGLSLLPTCDGHSDRDCRSDDGPRGLPHDRSSTYRDSPLTFLLLFLHLYLLQSDIRPSSHTRDLSLVVTLGSSELSGRLCQCRALTDYVIQKESRGIGWEKRRIGWKKGNCQFWQVGLTCRFHGHEKRGLRGSINMRMTRAAWFCALPDAHRVDIFIPVLEFMLNCEKLERWAFLNSWITDNAPIRLYRYWQ